MTATPPGTAPRVTAIVPTHHRPETLDRAVRAIFDQRYDGHIECLIVFDQADPHDIAARPGYNRSLRVITNVHSPGLAGARNSGIEAADGELIAFCDDDDEWLPDKLRLQVEALERNPASPLATCAIDVIYKDKVITRRTSGDLVTFDDLCRSRRMEVHSSTLLLRKDVLVNQIGPVDEEIPGSYGEDYDLLLRAAKVGPLVAVELPLVKVYWQSSYYSDRWGMIIDALQYQMRKHPELARYPRNRARMLSRLAYAYAASGQRAAARQWALQSLRLHWGQPRGYLALLVSAGLLRPALVARVANSLGRGV